MHKDFDKYRIRRWDIYKITNPIGQVYIGCSCLLKGRLSKYKHLKCHHQILLYGSLKKYGFDKHNVEVIDSFDSNYSYAKCKEIFWIRTNMSNYTQWPEMNGLNKSIGGSCAPQLQTKEARVKAKNVFKNNPNILIERGKKISKSKMGHCHSKGTIEKIRETRKRLYGREIIQYSINGEIINRFSNYTEAVYGSGVGKTAIYNSLRNLVSPKNFIFKYT